MRSGVVWINGCFGVGKSTVAAELVRSWPDAMIFDPERVGWLVHRIAPRHDDYQEIHLWRRLTRSATAALVRARRRPVVVPMTLVVPEYFDEIIGGLGRSGIDVRHFTLRASRDTVHQRLRQRPETTDWTWAQVDRCLAALDDPRFDVFVDTDGRSVAEVAGEIRRALDAPG